MMVDKRNNSSEDGDVNTLLQRAQQDIKQDMQRLAQLGDGPDDTNSREDVDNVLKDRSIDFHNDNSLLEVDAPGDETGDNGDGDGDGDGDEEDGEEDSVFDEEEQAE